MELVDGDRRVSLQIVGYQYPHWEVEPAKWDKWDDWLLVRGYVATPEESWEFTDPCLLTWEVEGLAKWFGRVATEPAPRAIEFIEPVLQFVSHGPVSGGVGVRVEFRMEATPDRRRNWDPYPVEFVVPAEQLQAAAESLRNDLRAFPMRWVPRPG